MRIYLVRHGESVTNRTGLFTGQSDVPLTELGERQAACVSSFFKDIPLEAVYSSDLSRAMETIRGAAQSQGLTVQPECDLREVYAGEWEGKHFTELPKLYPEDYRVWQEDLGASRCTGGESMVEAVGRADKAMRRIAEAHPNTAVAVASHGGIIRGLISLWVHGDLKHVREMPWAPNASVNIFEYENGTFRVVEIGVATHLGELLTEIPATV